MGKATRLQYIQKLLPFITYHGFLNRVLVLEDRKEYNPKQITRVKFLESKWTLISHLDFKVQANLVVDSYFYI